ncbi:hypothetical protein FE257_004672 [Aspergillus nanangensis]|uniref:Uncharacterized protein n=1 Tax=Aspergillus nanangensis TaxID=2582783 RepID=A0AAD4CYJ9_ASPNN|nr:hypothetical protein FE257_004672 [Aspergillus nanangensis]
MAFQAINIIATVPDNMNSPGPQTPDSTIQLKEEPTEAENQNQDIQVPETPVVATPKKRGRPKKTTTDEMAESDGSPTKKSKTPTPSKKSCGPIPTSLENATVTDRMILRMRDDEGRGWGDITKAWIDTTGINVGGSTLRMRYTTMKANFVSITNEDESRLLKAKKDVEDKFEQDKWHKIAESIKADGGMKYPHAALQKKFKELSKRIDAVAADE